MDEKPPKIISKKEILDFAASLERAGYSNALELINTKLVPLAISGNKSLYDAAWDYADQDEEQDTSYSQLFEALQNMVR